MACDFAINPLLVKEGFHPPLDLPIFHKYQGMIAEVIYPMIDDSIDTKPMDQYLYDDNPKDDANESDGGLREDSLKDNNKDNHQNNINSSGLVDKPSPLTLDEIQQLSSKWQKNLASSAQQVEKLDGGFVKLIDFSYARPSRLSVAMQYCHHLDLTKLILLLPLTLLAQSHQDEIDEFITEINAIKSNILASITLIACDEKVSKELIWHFEAWDADISSIIRRRVKALILILCLIMLIHKIPYPVY
ncbi:hypothetical protein [Candidatus Ruthturnera calyptogenae]|uniref:hypothetical protein n=1 Tax=Candidatus Ruthturnera calyptogenae TaxID=386487 RepID=UPI0006841B06|nr:hypothetical protein [Candidatus Ruthturnera calyptogenae]